MRFIIDRFEGIYAVCESEDKTILNIERSKLPVKAKEGDVLYVEANSIIIDENETKARKKKIEGMMKNLWE